MLAPNTKTRTDTKERQRKQKMAYRVRTKIKPEGAKAFGCGFTIVLLVGIFMLLSIFENLTVGLLGAMVLAACLWAVNSARACVCSECGNEVAPTSKICPTCQTELVGTKNFGFLLPKEKEEK